MRDFYQMSQYLIYCRHSWVGEPPSNAPTNQEESLAYIDRLYDDGTPLFTKDAIRAIDEQIQRKPGHGDKIFGKDLTGGDVEYEIQTGKRRKEINQDDELFERIYLKPVLSYRCRAHIKHDLWRCGFEDDKPNLSSLVLYHDTEARKEDTQELILPWPAAPRETVAESFRRQIQLWKENDMSSRLLEVLETSAAKHGITKVIGLSLGSFSLCTQGEDNKVDGHSARQHALLLTLRDWLLRHKEAFPCYVQDPVYNSTDESILKTYGVEIIEDPQAWLEMDHNTIVISVASNVPVKEIVADIARPAVVIWERVGFEDGDKEGETSCTDPFSPRVRAMMEEYEMFEIGKDTENFTDIVVYVRQELPQIKYAVEDEDEMQDLV